MEDEKFKIKQVFILKIKEAESFAKETFEISFKQDIFDLDLKKINDKHHTQLLSQYYTDIIKSYDNLFNLYKSSNDQFKFLNNEAENKLTEEDRFDFIATVLQGFLLDANNKNIDDNSLAEVLGQLKDIDNIIYETKSLELKTIAIKKIINEIEEEIRRNKNKVSSKTPQQNSNIDNYIQSYNQKSFIEIINKTKQDGAYNDFYLGNYFSEWLERKNKTLLDNQILKEKHVLLSDYNKLFYFLTNDIIKLFKVVNGYEKSNDNGFLTALKMSEDNIFEHLQNIEFFNKKTLKGGLLDDKLITVIDAKEYCIDLFDECINLVNEILSINIERSPLNENFENTRKSIKTAIDLEYFKLKTTPEKSEHLNPIPTNLDFHNDIFKYNAFEVFEIYKENKQINVNSRTDLRVIFELLKGDNLLVETIELKHYIKWLNRVYFNGDITELKKQNLNTKPNIVRTNDYIEYKKSTLKQP